jgi:hypothetical protein
MLATSVFIFNPQLVAGNTYTAEIYYNPASKAKYTNHGDVIEDTQGNQYEISNATSLPVDDGDQLTLLAITNNVLPEEDGDYDSTIFTPGQVKLTTDVKSSGEMSSPSVFSGPDYEYTVTCSWDSSVEANKALVGDRVVDAAGKEFELSFIDASNRFSVPCRVKEVDRVGDLPSTGPATLYRTTPELGLFQGTPVSDAARTVIRNRDMFLLDAAIQNVDSGSGASNALEKEMLNDSGDSLNALTPVRVTSSGSMDSVDVAIEAEALALVGVLKATTANAASGSVVLSGILPNISTSIDIGKDVYLSKTGTITDSKPDIGVDGFEDADFVIKLGTVMQNNDNPSNKDLHVNIQVVGQL